MIKGKFNTRIDPEQEKKISSYIEDYSVLFNSAVSKFRLSDLLEEMLDGQKQNWIDANHPKILNIIINNLKSNGVEIID